AEKILHRTEPGAGTAPRAADGAQLEEDKVQGAIATDFVLSAEIMTIALAALPDGGLVYRAAVLAVVAVAITALVYGSVALIVKVDDIGLHLHSRGKWAVTRRFGRGLVAGMPGFLKLLTIVGTAAMLWVGGAIILHALAELHLEAPEHWVHEAAVLAGSAAPPVRGLVTWLVSATLSGLIGLALGAVLVRTLSLWTHRKTGAKSDNTTQNKNKDDDSHD
ncbi:MAG: DUF808 family protein, partial [Pseudomonadota bacterium]